MSPAAQIRPTKTLPAQIKASTTINNGPAWYTAMAHQTSGRFATIHLLLVMVVMSFLYLAVTAPIIQTLELSPFQLVIP
jgi:lipoprotein signal peptidase